MTQSDMIEHHVKYKEIHGVDETVMMTRSEHKLLHNRLRRDGKCNIPPDELKKISQAAQQRTDKYKEYQRNYSKQEYREHCMNAGTMSEIVKIQRTNRAAFVTIPSNYAKTREGVTHMKVFENENGNLEYKVVED